jgi:hypothetical protein
MGTTTSTTATTLQSALVGTRVDRYSITKDWTLLCALLVKKIDKTYVGVHLSTLVGTVAWLVDCQRRKADRKGARKPTAYSAVADCLAGPPATASKRCINL